MTSSILTPSQSGIIGEGGRKVLKTRVQLLGRFLMEPGDELSLETATKLAERARASKTRVRTQLTLFSAGMRLGERGVFASMPHEFVKYHRLSDLVAPGARFPAVLVVCVRDFNQRSATVIQFKDDVCLRVVIDVIGRHRRSLEDDVARMSDLHSSLGSLAHRDGRGGGGGRQAAGNWRLEATADDAVPAESAVDGAGGQRPNSQQRQASASTSMMTEEGDYAVIRRSRMLWSSGSSNLGGGENSLVTSQHRLDSGDGGGSEALATSSETMEQQQQQQPTTVQQVLLHDWQQQQQQHQQRYQKRQHPHHQQRQWQQHKQQQQHSWTFGTANNRDGSAAAAIAEADASMDEVETAAIFETPEGPPTLLNELVRRAHRGGGGSGSGGGGGGSSSRRVMELPPEFVARAHVSQSESANGSDEPGAPNAQWPDLLGED